MKPVEQVILYVRTTGRRRIVEVSASTELVRAFDIAELIGWFDQNGTETILRFDTPNLFFHPLPSGGFAVGIVFPRSDKAFFVRVLVVPPKTLLNFSNNPIALYRHLTQQQQIPPFRRPPHRVHPLKVVQGSPPFDRQAVLQVVNRLGAAVIGRLVWSLQDSLSTFFTSSLGAADVIDAVLNLFPVHLRTELTFATEPFFSVLTPLRLVGVSGDRQQIAEQATALGVPLFDLDVPESESPKNKNGPEFDGDSWPYFVENVLRGGNFDLFESYVKNEGAWSLADECGELTSTLETEPAVTPRQQELLTQIDTAITHVLHGNTDAVPSLRRDWQELQRLLSWDEQERRREEWIARIHSVYVNSSARTPVQNVGLLDILLIFIGK